MFVLSYTNEILYEFSLPELMLRASDVRYAGQGWGLAFWRARHRFLQSNGSHLLTLRDADTFEPLTTLAIVDAAGNAVTRLNELEMIGDNRLLINVWFAEQLLLVDLLTLHVETIDVQRLTSDADEGIKSRQLCGAATANGVAYDETSDTLLLLGKYWKSMYQVRITNDNDSSFVPIGVGNGVDVDDVTTTTVHPSTQPSITSTTSTSSSSSSSASSSTTATTTTTTAFVTMIISTISMITSSVDKLTSLSTTNYDLTTQSTFIPTTTPTPTTTKETSTSMTSSETTTMTTKLSASTSSPSSHLSTSINSSPLQSSTTTTMLSSTNTIVVVVSDSCRRASISMIFGVLVLAINLFF
jgi:hypothetical protein